MSIGRDGLRFCGTGGGVVCCVVRDDELPEPFPLFVEELPVGGIGSPCTPVLSEAAKPAPKISGKTPPTLAINKLGLGTVRALSLSRSRSLFLLEDLPDDVAP